MKHIDVTEGTRALAAAREADEQLWTTQARSAYYREVRGQAIVTALDAGVPPEQIAEVLGVRASDIERMARRAGRAPVVLTDETAPTPSEGSAGTAETGR